MTKRTHWKCYAEWTFSEFVGYNSDQGTKQWPCVSVFINSVWGFRIEFPQSTSEYSSSWSVLLQSATIVRETRIPFNNQLLFCHSSSRLYFQLHSELKQTANSSQAGRMLMTAMHRQFLKLGFKIHKHATFKWRFETEGFFSASLRCTICP